MSARSDSRRQLDILSVRALADLLRQICAEPGPFGGATAVGKALRSQGALARFADSDLGIRSMSLNHQKSVSMEVLGSFSALDDLRRAAVNALAADRAKAMRGNRTTKVGLLARVKELTEERALLLEDLFILQRAYDLRCLHARSYARDGSAATRARCAKEQKEVDASFQLRKRVLGPNVYELGSGKGGERGQ